MARKRSTAVIVQPQVQASLTPAQLLTIAVEKGADIEKLAQLMELQQKWEANEARKAYNAALAAFKADPPKISKNRRVGFDTGRGRTEYKHATLDHVCDAVGSALTKHGLNHHWELDQKDSLIIVTCVLTHIMGHSERVTMSGPPDDSGSKNKIQQSGSTVTYLQRYTLLAATGLAAANTDNDGAGAAGNGGGGMPEGELADHLAAIDASADAKGLQQAFASAYRAAQKYKDNPAIARLTEAKDLRKQALGVK